MQNISLHNNKTTQEMTNNSNPADTDVFKTSPERLKKVTTSYNQTRHRHNVWQKTLDLRPLEDVGSTLS